MIYASIVSSDENLPFYYSAVFSSIQEFFGPDTGILEIIWYNEGQLILHPGGVVIFRYDVTSCGDAGFIVPGDSHGPQTGLGMTWFGPVGTSIAHPLTENQLR
jgi:hypothetical protein